jgi:hypothetical protein
MAPTSVASPASVEPSVAVKAAAVETTKAHLAPETIASGNSPMAEPTEGAGVRSSRCVRVARPTKPLISVKTSTMRIGMIEVRSSRMKTIAIDDGPAMRNVCVVVVFDSAAVAPIVSPTVPTPAEARK